MTAAKDHPAPSEPPSYVWSFPGAPVRVRLTIDVVQRLAPYFFSGDGADPFGLLFGYTDGPTTHISGFQPLAAAGMLEVGTELAKLGSLSDGPRWSVTIAPSGRRSCV